MPMNPGAFLRLFGVSGNNPVSQNDPLPVTTGGTLYGWAYTTGYFTPYATPTDILTIAGSASRTIRIVRIIVSSTQTTAGINQWFAIQRTTADTGGASTAVTGVPLAVANPVATASVLKWTAAPTINSTIGTYRAAEILSPAPTTVAAGDYVLWDDQYQGQSITLVGTAQQCAINFAGAAVPSGLSVSFTVILTEQ
jgi:hypothetical protein